VGDASACRVAPDRATDEPPSEPRRLSAPRPYAATDLSGRGSCWISENTFQSKVVRFSTDQMDLTGQLSNRGLQVLLQSLTAGAH
jgi:hypothetical protein